MSIQVFMRTTLVRVKLEWAIWVSGAYAKNWVRDATFDLGPWWKDYRGRQEEKARARAAAKARKRAKAKRRERAKKIAGDEILGGVQRLSRSQARRTDMPCFRRNVRWRAYPHSLSVAVNSTLHP